jgi:hypothetical protein
MVPAMEKVPESATAVHELLQWIGYARDAAWATKLAILRLAHREDIERFGSFLAEHDRHATELGQLLRAAAPGSEVPGEPPFITRDPHVIGALSDADTVIAASSALEISRIARYDARPRHPDHEPHRVLDAVLERHAVDARLRLAWLTDRRSSRLLARGAAA